MNFQEDANFITQHPLTVLGIGWGVTMLAGGVTFYVLPALKPKRPIKFSKEYLAAKAEADAAMADLSLK